MFVYSVSFEFFLLSFSGWIVSEWCSVLLHCWTHQLILSAIVTLHSCSVM